MATSLPAYFNDPEWYKKLDSIYAMDISIVPSNQYTTTFSDSDTTWTTTTTSSSSGTFYEHVTGSTSGDWIISSPYITDPYITGTGTGIITNPTTPYTVTWPPYPQTVDPINQEDIERIVREVLAGTPPASEIAQRVKEATDKIEEETAISIFVIKHRKRLVQRQIELEEIEG
jgi:hypothetical protein